MGKIEGLVGHKSSFEIHGKAVGIDSDKFLTSGVASNGKKWRRINFAVRTSPDSLIYIEKMGIEQDKAYAYSSKDKKSKAVDWDNRNNKNAVPNGYHIITPDWDKIDEFEDILEEGKDIRVYGEIQYSEYNDKPQIRFVAKTVNELKKEIDFDSEEFTEKNSFFQEITVVDTEFNKEENKIYLTAYIIQDRGKEKLQDIQTATFVFYPERDKKLAKKIMDFKFGDTLKIKGVINHKVIKEDVVVEEGWGDYTSEIVRTLKEMEIVGADPSTYTKKLYKEADFEEYFTAMNKEEEAKEFTQEDDDGKLPWED